MIWSKIAIEDLSRYEKLKQAIEHAKERIELLDARLYGTRGLQTSPVPTSGDCSQLEDAVVNALCERDQLLRSIELNEKLVAWIEKGLSQLDYEERLVLDSFFIHRHRGHVEDLMEQLRYEKTQIYRIKDRALRKYVLCMHGLTET